MHLSRKITSGLNRTEIAVIARQYGTWRRLPTGDDDIQYVSSNYRNEVSRYTRPR
jgi:hypothetical protein